MWARFGVAELGACVLARASRASIKSMRSYRPARSQQIKRNRGSSFSVTSYRTCVDPRHALVLVEGARSPRCTCHFMGRPQEKICWYKKRALSRIYVYKQVSGTEFLYSVSEAAEVALYTSSTVPEGRVMCSTVVLCAWCTRTVRVELHRNVRTHPVFGQHHSGGAHVCVCCSM